MFFVLNLENKPKFLGLQKRLTLVNKGPGAFIKRGWWPLKDLESWIFWGLWGGGLVCVCADESRKYNVREAAYCRFSAAKIRPGPAWSSFSLSAAPASFSAAQEQLAVSHLRDCQKADFSSKFNFRDEKWDSTLRGFVFCLHLFTFSNFECFVFASFLTRDQKGRGSKNLIHRNKR